MNTPQNISVELEFTPNPNTLKYVTSSAFLLTGAANFPTQATAEGRSELAMDLFGLGSISAVMVGKNFVTVTLTDQDTLTELNDGIIATIKKFIASGRQAVKLDAITQGSTDTSNLSDIEQQIVQILDEQIRPAVAQDGGDIVFEKFEDGIVFLHMRGSCAGCPSSTATLKMGIENRLKDAIPQVKEVVSL